MVRPSHDRAALAAGLAAPLVLALTEFLIWPAPASSCGGPHVDQTPWRHGMGALAVAAMVGLGCLLWTRRRAGAETGGLRRVPWEPILVAGLSAALWVTQLWELFVVNLTAVGVVALALLVVAAVGLRRGESRWVTVSIWCDALLLVPAVYVAGVVLSAPLFCF